MNLKEWRQQIADPLVRIAMSCIHNTFPQLCLKGYCMQAGQELDKTFDAQYSVMNTNNSQRCAEFFIAYDKAATVTLYLHEVLAKYCEPDSFDKLAKHCSLTIDELL